MGTNPDSTSQISRYVASPTTILVDSSDEYTLRNLPEGVQVSLEQSLIAVVGQPIVLPQSSSLPGGFVGKIVSIGSDGRTLNLKQAPLNHAFDFVEVSIPDLSEIADTAESSTANEIDGNHLMSTRETRTLNFDGCNLGLSTSDFIEIQDPQFDVSGSFNLVLNNGIFTSTGNSQASILIDTDLTITAKVNIEAKLDKSFTCGVPLPTIVRNFQTGYVPMMLRFKPEAELELAGNVDFKIEDLELTAGYEGTAYIPFSLSESPTVTATSLLDLSWSSPTLEASMSAGVRLGGTLSLGPGVGSDSAGVQAGLSGKVSPLILETEISIGTNVPLCLETFVGSEMDLEIFAAAWLTGYELESAISLFNERKPYGPSSGWWNQNFPAGCEFSNTTDPDPPEDPEQYSDWSSVALGDYHGCGIKMAGELWCWGQNFAAQLGIGNTLDRPKPSRVGDDDDWLEISAGNAETCGIRAEGELWCWGSNSDGELGLGDTDQRLTPTRVGTESDWTSISIIGSTHTCGIRAEGELWCWGWNSDGQLGLGDTDQRLTPTRVGTESDWTSISIENDSSCGIRAEGELWCWGSNIVPAMGIGFWPLIPSPVRIESDSDWEDVSLGSDHWCALKLTGEIWCWGSNSNGQLGTGDLDERLYLTQVGESSDWMHLSASGVRTCAIRSNGGLWCWGYNGDGGLGTGTIGGQQKEPIHIEPSSSWQNFSTENSHSCGIRMSNQLWCWGYLTTDNLIPIYQQSPKQPQRIPD